MKLDKNRLTYMISEAIESVYNNEKNEGIDGVEEVNKEEEFNEQPTNNMVGNEKALNTENKYMKKQVVRLTEADLHKIIKESVKRIIREKAYQGAEIEQHEKNKQKEGAWKIKKHQDDTARYDAYDKLEDAYKKRNGNQKDDKGKRSMKTMEKLKK